MVGTLNAATIKHQMVSNATQRGPEDDLSVSHASSVQAASVNLEHSMKPVTASPSPVAAHKVLAAGGYHNLAVGGDGQLYAWGLNQNGQLGLGDTAQHISPVVVSLPDGVHPTALAVGQSHSLTIASDRKLYAWGNNETGQLGIGVRAQDPTPVQVALPGGVFPLTVAAGGQHSLAIGDDGRLYAWGFNNFGNLGDGTQAYKTKPVSVGLPAGVVPTHLAAGYHHTLAMGNDGKLYTWGLNRYGQLGIGKRIPLSLKPVVVNLPPGVQPVAVAAGESHSLAIGSDGKLYAWGRNNFGQLGTGDTIQHQTPVVVNLADGVSPIFVAAGADHSLAIGSDGNLYAWGFNRFGQLGDGSTQNSAIPKALSLPGQVKPVMVAAGRHHSVILGSEGKLYAWGLNADGTLGNGTTNGSPSPVEVVGLTMPQAK